MVFNLPRLLEVLLAYRGREAFGVGWLIAEIVERYGELQPDLWEVLGEVTEEYSYVMKAVAFEQRLGVLEGSFWWRLERMIYDSGFGSEMGAVCLRTLLWRGEGMIGFGERNGKNGRVVLWVPSMWCAGDAYLGM